jgi:hypothetical protein
VFLFSYIYIYKFLFVSAAVSLFFSAFSVHRLIFLLRVCTSVRDPRCSLERSVRCQLCCEDRREDVLLIQEKPLPRGAELPPLLPSACLFFSSFPFKKKRGKRRKTGRLTRCPPFFFLHPSSHFFFSYNALCFADCICVLWCCHGYIASERKKERPWQRICQFLLP